MNARKLMLALAIFSACSHAQEKLFHAGDLSESALIEALDPDAQARQRASAQVMRSIRVLREDRPAAQPKASLLVTFATNSAVLTQEARNALDVVARALASNQLANFQFSIEGHADPRGTHEGNLQLSQLRAEAVRRYLAQTGKIDAARLQAIGKGDSEPLDLENPEAQKNRRVTIATLVR